MKKILMSVSTLAMLSAGLYAEILPATAANTEQNRDNPFADGSTGGSGTNSTQNNSGAGSTGGQNVQNNSFGAGFTGGTGSTGNVDIFESKAPEQPVPPPAIPEIVGGSTGGQSVQNNSVRDGLSELPFPSSNEEAAEQKGAAEKQVGVSLDGITPMMGRDRELPGLDTTVPAPANDAPKPVDAPKEPDVKAEMETLGALRQKYQDLSRSAPDPFAALALDIKKQVDAVKDALKNEANKGNNDLLTRPEGYPGDKSEWEKANELYTTYKTLEKKKTVNDDQIVKQTQMRDATELEHNKFLRDNAVQVERVLAKRPPSMKALQREITNLTDQSREIDISITNSEKFITRNNAHIKEIQEELESAKATFEERKVGMNQDSINTLTQQLMSFEEDSKKELANLRADNERKTKDSDKLKAEKKTLTEKITNVRKEIESTSKAEKLKIANNSINESKELLSGAMIIEREKEFSEKIATLTKEIENLEKNKEPFDRRLEDTKKEYLAAYKVFLDNAFQPIVASLESSRGIAGASCPTGTTDCTQRWVQMNMATINDQVGGNPNVLASLTSVVNNESLLEAEAAAAKQKALADQEPEAKAAEAEEAAAKAKAAEAAAAKAKEDAEAAAKAAAKAEEEAVTNRALGDAANVRVPSSTEVMPAAVAADEGISFVKRGSLKGMFGGEPAVNPAKVASVAAPVLPETIPVETASQTPAPGASTIVGTVDGGAQPLASQTPAPGAISETAGAINVNADTIDAAANNLAPNANDVTASAAATVAQPLASLTTTTGAPSDGTAAATLADEAAAAKAKQLNDSYLRLEEKVKETQKNRNALNNLPNRGSDRVIADHILNTATQNRDNALRAIRTNEAAAKTKQQLNSEQEELDRKLAALKIQKTQVNKMKTGVAKGNASRTLIAEERRINEAKSIVAAALRTKR